MPPYCLFCLLPMRMHIVVLREMYCHCITSMIISPLFCLCSLCTYVELFFMLQINTPVISCWTLVIVNKFISVILTHTGKEKVTGKLLSFITLKLKPLLVWTATHYDFSICWTCVKGQKRERVRERARDREKREKENGRNSGHGPVIKQFSASSDGWKDGIGHTHTDAYTTCYCTHSPSRMWHMTHPPHALLSMFKRLGPNLEKAVVWKSLKCASLWTISKSYFIVYGRLHLSNEKTMWMCKYLNSENTENTISQLSINSPR